MIFDKGREVSLNKPAAAKQGKLEGRTCPDPWTERQESSQGGRTRKRDLYRPSHTIKNCETGKKTTLGDAKLN